MGQYYMVVNLTKKQFISPNKFGDGLKLLEFGCSGNGTMTALSLLLASGNGRGGGDLMPHDNDQYEKVMKIVGSWVGDKIAIIGDYSDGVAVGLDEVVMYDTIKEPEWTDVSAEIREVMAFDPYIEAEMAEEW